MVCQPPFRLRYPLFLEQSFGNTLGEFSSISSNSIDGNSLLLQRFT